MTSRTCRAARASYARKKRRSQNGTKLDATHEIVALRQIKNVVQYYITFRDLFLVQANWVREDLAEHALAVPSNSSQWTYSGTEKWKRD